MLVALDTLPYYAPPGGGVGVELSLAVQRFPRYQIQLPVLRKASSDATRVEVGWTRDLSLSGACLQFPACLPAPAEIWLRLQTNGGPIELEARVVWTCEVPGSRQGALHGVAFIGATRVQCQALEEMLAARERAFESSLRLPLELPVTCHPENGAEPPLLGRTVDFSRRGVLVLLDRPMPAGASLNVVLHTGWGPLTAEGVVVWANSAGGNPPGTAVQHGLRLTSLSWSTPLVLGLELADPSH
jgi:hypothetical protein